MTIELSTAREHVVIDKPMSSGRSSGSSKVVVMRAVMISAEARVAIESTNDDSVNPSGLGMLLHL